MRSQLYTLLTYFTVTSFGDLVAPDGQRIGVRADKDTCSGPGGVACALKEERECWDGYPCCTEWGRRNQCEENKDWMARNCKVTCKKCKKTGSYEGCKDFYPECAMWAREGQCRSNKEWMYNNCRVACKTCDMFSPDKLKQNCKI